MYLKMSDPDNRRLEHEGGSPIEEQHESTEKNGICRSEAVDEGTRVETPSPPQNNQGSPELYSRFNIQHTPGLPMLTPIPRNRSPTPTGNDVDVAYDNEYRRDYAVDKHSMIEISQNDMTEGNMAALALTNQENLDSHSNGIRDENDAPPENEIKSEPINDDSQSYISERSVYTDISAHSNNESASLTNLTPYGGHLVTGLSTNGHLSRSGYQVQPMTQFQPGIQSTQYNIFDNTGHLLPQEDVEDFFKNMDRPMATSVSVAGMFSGSIENGQYTTLTNTPGLTLAQTYQPNTESSRLMTFHPPSYSDSQNPYALTQLYGSRLSGLQSQYISVEDGNRSSPAPNSNATWGVSAESPYSNSPSTHGITLSAHKFGYQNDSPEPRESGLSASPIQNQFSRTTVLNAGTTYGSYVSQDGNSWMYQNMPSPYTDVKVTGEFSKCAPFN